MALKGSEDFKGKSIFRATPPRKSPRISVKYSGVHRSLFWEVRAKEPCGQDSGSGNAVHIYHIKRLRDMSR